jgi:hypothetical protein
MLTVLLAGQGSSSVAADDKPTLPAWAGRSGRRRVRRAYGDSQQDDLCGTRPGETCQRA